VSRIVTEKEFRQSVIDKMTDLQYTNKQFDFVVGPGRSGAIASVYVSHLLGIPFLQYIHKPDIHKRLLIVDTARFTGKTLRRIRTLYKDYDGRVVWFYDEPPRVRFWYEDLTL
jgi:adenine/guanine phosphoribosyltransferase-like PRPP-binding protein